MWMIIICLVVGILIGYFNILPDDFGKLASYLTTSGLFLLLLTMGISIGINNQIIDNLDKLGIEAIILAAGSVVGSVVLLLFFELYFKSSDE